MRTCFWHDWTKWTDIASGSLTRIVINGVESMKADGPDIGRFVLQQRECGRCGKKELSRTAIRVDHG